MHFCVSSISEWWFIWRLCYIRNVLLFPTHLMCTRHLISERLSTYSWFQPGSVKFILLCKYSCIPLKALSNIVEDRFKLVELWCLCCIMMFRWINKQPGMQMVWNWCCHYQEICDWISSFNKQSGLPLILTQQSMAENEYGNLVTCRFSPFEALNDAFEVQFFQGFIFTPYQRHW